MCVFRLTKKKVPCFFFLKRNQFRVLILFLVGNSGGQRFLKLFVVGSYTKLFRTTCSFIMEPIETSGHMSSIHLHPGEVFFLTVHLADSYVFVGSVDQHLPFFQLVHLK